MYPKITSKAGLTGNTDHDCHKIKIEHDVIDKSTKPVQNLLSPYDDIGDNLFPRKLMRFRKPWCAPYYHPC